MRRGGNHYTALGDFGSIKRKFDQGGSTSFHTNYVGKKLFLHHLSWTNTSTVNNNNNNNYNNNNNNKNPICSLSPELAFTYLSLQLCVREQHWFCVCPGGISNLLSAGYFTWLNSPICQSSSGRSFLGPLSRCGMEKLSDILKVMWVGHGRRS